MSRTVDHVVGMLVPCLLFLGSSANLLRCFAVMNIVLATGTPQAFFLEPAEDATETEAED